MPAPCRQMFRANSCDAIQDDDCRQTTGEQPKNSLTKPMNDPCEQGFGRLMLSNDNESAFILVQIWSALIHRRKVGRSFDRPAGQLETTAVVTIELGQLIPINQPEVAEHECGSEFLGQRAQGDRQISRSIRVVVATSPNISDVGACRCPDAISRTGNTENRCHSTGL
jgi:hypothetical protein